MVAGSNPARGTYMNLLIFGPPGAGKGTQASLIAKKYHLTHLSSGDILRSEIKGGELGEKIKKHLAAGKLAPDKLIIEMMGKAISGVKTQGVILDGYPRTIKQAKALDKLLKAGKTALAAVVNLKLNEDEATKRILERGKTSGRSDDNSKTIKARLKIYRTQTAPLLEYYKEQGKIINIDGQPAIAAVFKNIQKKLLALK
jgi:adenylate kinase